MTNKKSKKTTGKKTATKKAPTSNVRKKTSSVSKATTRRQVLKKIKKVAAKVAKPAPKKSGRPAHKKVAKPLALVPAPKVTPKKRVRRTNAQIAADKEAAVEKLATQIANDGKSAAEQLKELVEAIPEPTPAEPVIPVDVGTLNDLEDTGFAEMCTQHRALSAKIKALEIHKKELGEVIRPLMEMVDATSVTGFGWHAMITQASRSKLSPEKLLENGVTVRQIADSTVKTPYDFLQIREAKEAKVG